jgi:hypothetical protein
VKLRELLTKIDDAVRPAHVAGESGVSDSADTFFPAGPGRDSAPVTWVPSQEDSGPTHDGGVL